MHTEVGSTVESVTVHGSFEDDCKRVQMVKYHSAIVCTGTHLEYANLASKSSCLRPGSRDLFGALNFELTFDLDTPTYEHQDNEKDMRLP